MDFNCKANNTMEEPIKLESWEKFEEELVRINERTKVLQQEGQLSHMEYPLYRGVSDFKYHLKSTLDRTKEGMSFSEYHGIVKTVHKHVATCTDRKWDLETKEPKLHLGELDLPLSTYEFMAYLRHNEFPSPLIDWTKSPYIAAFFAFRKTCPETEYVSIFVHMGNLLCGQDPCSIWTLGPTIATDRKHYLQQSEYSICFREDKGEIFFTNHEDVIKDEEGKYILIKYKIPVSERQKFLGKLDSMNITAYSLFGSEPSLMETLSLREIMLKQKNVF